MAKSTIWKAVLEPSGKQEIKIPAKAVILTAREQGDNIAIWYLCDPDAPRSPRTIYIFGTGEPITDASAMRHLGSASLKGGRLIFHVFEGT